MYVRTKVSNVGGEDALPPLREGGREPCPPFQFTQNAVFETSRDEKTTDNDGNKSIRPCLIFV